MFILFKCKPFLSFLLAILKIFLFLESHAREENPLGGIRAEAGIFHEEYRDLPVAGRVPRDGGYVRISCSRAGGAGAYARPGAACAPGRDMSGMLQ